ncbi:MAG: hypothetical protein E5Y67_03600 [Mesorhizobium sp.]|uniref:hypothetical protein n=1 Tax=Mesorhizobium sp. TaxID=1871066 RepID=UPI0011F4C8F4|nr:hypothetical protein [Mesorhizobium sp.]TIM16290.1 MAG: hypothetical protein E5Y67_03600 [Mesorhizobium sp.]
MTIVYRTDGAWGVGQGYNLTALQVDGNFYDLDQRIQAIEDNPPEPVNISHMTVVGTQWTIYLEDATAFGPFTLPQANFRPSVVATVATNTHAPVLADANSYKRCTHVDGCTVTVPLNAAVAFPVDTELTYRQAADEPIIFDTLTDGPTLNGIAGFLDMSGGRGATVTLKKVATDEWDLIGLLAEDVTA